ncbi:polyphosphate kinase 2 [Flavobacteriaceae bacterium]|jgi:polyphosphate kinase|nr:polyphosphate kinase 2 [Flavobacteriaceae bacterium]MDC1492046.1 polyphosphate kinase 2 [Flavobacteriaceae bacterium]MDC1535037.1 polyphosphate kinase 2 [Flavobacteriaceae bacterium]
MLKPVDISNYFNKSHFLEILKNRFSKAKYNSIINTVSYNNQLLELQSSLVDLQNWIYNNNKKVCIIFEGRDAAGKGGAIKRFTQHLNPRTTRVVALAKPTSKEKGQWYFQRYIKELPNNGEIVFFDRSWYNRAIIEPVMGFCSDKEYNVFMDQVNDFEKMITQENIILIKFWFSITKKTQKDRFNNRLSNPLKRWKFSVVDKEGQKKWNIYSDYKNKMLDKTNTTINPWTIIKSDNKQSSRLESIKHVLSMFEFSRTKISNALNTSKK